MLETRLNFEKLKKIFFVTYQFILVSPTYIFRCALCSELKIQHIFLTIFWDSGHSETEGTESAKGQSSKTAARCHFCRTAIMHCCAFTILALLCWRDLRISGYLWTVYNLFWMQVIFGRLDTRLFNPELKPWASTPDILTPDFSTIDFSTPDFSTIIFWTMWLKSSW